MTKTTIIDTFKQYKELLQLPSLEDKENYFRYQMMSEIKGM